MAQFRSNIKVVITRGQRHLAKAAPNDPAHKARGVHCTRRRCGADLSRVTDRQTDRHHERQ